MTQTIYDFKVLNTKGEEVKLSDYKGKVLLIVNIASKCGLTPQLADLESLYRNYKDKGFDILAFPCDQFANQSPEDGEGMREFCSMKYEVSFEVFEKIEVNGDNASDLYKHLRSQKFGWFGDKIKWNFAKFLINKQGEVVKRYSPTKAPLKISKDIEKLI